MSHSFVVGERPRLEVRIPSGRISISEGLGGLVVVDLEGRGADSIEVVQVGDTVAVRRIEGGRLRSSSVVVRAEVPAGCRIEMALASADVEVTGGVGSIVLRTASGDLRADSAASLDATSASGDISVGTVAGDVSIASASGDVHLGSVGGKLSVKLASGDMAVREVAGACRCSSASGDITVGACHGDEVSVKTVSGDLRLGFPPGIRLEADCTSLSGRIRFPEPAEDGPEGDRRYVRLAGRSVSGDIVVERTKG